jgi:hypothetical protein
MVCGMYSVMMTEYMFDERIRCRSRVMEGEGPGEKRVRVRGSKAYPIPLSVFYSAGYGFMVVTNGKKCFVFETQFSMHT